ncbi:thymosin beta-4-like [Saccopteryx leptura]|uniref:thymosin beta-4-like n=1 Tax=Saccopteryx leptura TaxID=249018 RepID=UPI00339C982A
MADKPNMAETEKFGKSKPKTETQENYPLPSKEMTEQEKQTHHNEATPPMCTVPSTSTAF